MPFTVELSARAKRDLARFPAQVQTRIVRALRGIAPNPRRAPNTKRLSGPRVAYRLRVGDYRILYEIHDDRLLVLVIRIGHRREVYRDPGE